MCYKERRIDVGEEYNHLITIVIHEDNSLSLVLTKGDEHFYAPLTELIRAYGNMLSRILSHSSVGEGVTHCVCPDWDEKKGCVTPGGECERLGS